MGSSLPGIAGQCRSPSRPAVHQISFGKRVVLYQEVQAWLADLEPAQGNIVAAYDADQAQGVHFLVMEFVDGHDLARLEKKQGPLLIDQAVQCLLQAARAWNFWTWFPLGDPAAGLNGVPRSVRIEKLGGLGDNQE